MNTLTNVETRTAAAPTLIAPASFTDQADLVRVHSRLVKRIARSVFMNMSPATPIDDLVQIGNVALLDAARHFEDRGVAQFATYAGIRIRGAMIDELRRSATVSRQGLKNRRQFTAVRAKLTCSLGRAPTDLEMAASLKMTVTDYRSALSGTHGLAYESIECAYSDSDPSYADDSPSALEQLQKAEFKQELARAIAALPGKQGLILQLYFVDELDLTTIGQLLDVGASRICQLKKEALKTLRSQMADFYPQ